MLKAIETERLILRPFTDKDYSDVYEYMSDAETLEYEPYLPMTPEEARANLENWAQSKEMTAVTLRDTGKVIGGVYLGAREFDALELGYVFNKAYWGMGYAHEACSALVQRAFREGTHRIYAECDPDNSRSWRLLERLVFTKEACHRANVYFWRDEDGKPLWKDTFVYARLNPSFSKEGRAL